MNNTAGIILGVVMGIALGGFGGYTAGQKGTDTVNAKQVSDMTMMMKLDGANMEKMGGLMMEAGAMLQDRGTKYNDQEMVMKGKDLSVNGAKHQSDGKSMTGGDMMGMTANGNMQDMPGMDMKDMKM